MGRRRIRSRGGSHIVGFDPTGGGDIVGFHPTGKGHTVGFDPARERPPPPRGISFELEYLSEFEFIFETDLWYQSECCGTDFHCKKP